MAEQPKGPKNKKGRPMGSGTTNEKRKAARANKQWSNLENADPSSPTHLLKHLEALEKAQKKCQERLKEEIQKSLEKLPGNKKGAEVPHGGCKHRAKSGQPRKAQLTPRSFVDVAKEALDLEKSKGAASSEPSSKVLKKTKEENAQASSAAPMDLGKSKKEKDLEKSKATHGQNKDLEKSHAVGLEKPTVKPKVLVDWHHTLEFHGHVSDDDLFALEKLLSKAEVIILSYVASQGRAKKVPEEIEDLIPFHHKLLGKEICWKKVGNHGKVALAYNWGATAIFDDNVDICKEASAWNLEYYPIEGWGWHSWCGGGYASFAKAVDAYLKVHEDD